MKILKRLGASALAIGVATAGMVMTAPLASAHTGTLTTSAVCSDDGTYTVTYTGQTKNVPTSGPGHTATLTIGEVKPVGSTISDVPPTVTGNTTYAFHQSVAGTATQAQATAFLTWGDGAKSDPIGKIDLPGDCKPPVTPVAPSGNLAKDCVDDAGHVFAGKLDNGTAESVSWRLVTGTNGSHDTVVAGPTSGKPLEASGLANATKVWLQYNTGEGWVDEGSVVTTGDCTPVTPVTPSGTLRTDCVEGAGQVVAADLDSGTFEGVTWRLVTGTNDSHDTVVAGPSATTPLQASGLADATEVWLQYKTGDTWVDEGSVVTTGDCTPGVRSLGIVKSVSPTGSAKFGDTLTYTLKVTAGGTLGQTNVVVSDYIPGYKPGRDSGTTTYVPGSASCDAGACTASYDGSAKLVTWGLGDMAAGTSRTVSFQVVIDTPVNTIGAAAGVTIYNSAAVASTETPNTPSNEVQTPVTAVLGVTHTKSPPASQPTAVLGVSLAHTGGPAHLPWTLGFAALLLLLGSALIFLTRQPQTARVPS